MNPRNVYKIKQSFLMQDNNKWESGTDYNRHTALSLKRYVSSFCGSDTNQHHTSTSHVKQFSTNGKNAVVTTEFMRDIWSYRGRIYLATRIIFLTITESEPKRIVVSSKLKQTIMKMVHKYADHLGVIVRYQDVLLTHKELKEHFGEQELRNRKSKYLGTKFWTGQIWINTEMHLEKYGDDKKALKKKLQNTVIHELVHRKFPSMHHKGAKGKRAFHARINQIKRGTRYD